MNESPDFGITERIGQMSPPVLMMFVISVILRILKMSKKIQQEDWIFAAVAVVLGGISYPFIAEVGSVSYSVPYPALMLVGYGMAMGGLTVTVHDTFWRFIAARTGIRTGNTEIIVKETVSSDASKQPVPTTPQRNF